MIFEVFVEISWNSFNAVFGGFGEFGGLMVRGIYTPRGQRPRRILGGSHRSRIENESCVDSRVGFRCSKIGVMRRRTGAQSENIAKCKENLWKRKEKQFGKGVFWGCSWGGPAEPADQA